MFHECPINLALLEGGEVHKPINLILFIPFHGLLVNEYESFSFTMVYDF